MPDLMPALLIAPNFLVMHWALPPTPRVQVSDLVGVLGHEGSCSASSLADPVSPPNMRVLFCLYTGKVFPCH